MNAASILVSQKHRALVMPFRKDVHNLIPHSKTDGRHILIPHRSEETRLLRNLGIEAPAPILHHYDWGGTSAFDNQKQTAALLTCNRKAFVLSEMGVGKTRAAVYAADYLLQTKEAANVLVVAPLSTLNPTWAAEFMRVMPRENVIVLHGTRKRRQKLLDTPGARVFVINHDGVETIQSLLLKVKFDIVIIDELLKYRNHRSIRWKMLNPIVRAAKYAWGMTGAPIPNSPLDAYGQIKLLRPENIGRYTQFRDDVMYRVTTFLWTPRKDAAERVYELMQPSVRFKLSDCVDIPETTYSIRNVPLSKTQQKFYDAIYRQAHAQYKQHAITIANEGVKMGKLLQVAGGYVLTNQKKVLGLQPKNRLQEVMDILQECDHKVIVFVPYVSSLLQVYKHVSQHYTTALVYGKVSKSERDRIFYEFQHADDPRVLVAQPDAMSHGLTLTRSKVIVWYTPTTNLDTFIQANARIRRTGQTAKTTVIKLEGTPVERKAYARLQNKEKVQGVLLDMFEGVNDNA